MKKKTLTKVIPIRVSEMDQEILQERSSFCKLPVATYIRETALGYKPKAAFTPQELEYINLIFEALVNVRNFNAAFREFTKDMTKEDRDRYVLDGKTISNWGIRLEGVLDVLEKIKNETKRY